MRRAFYRLGLPAGLLLGLAGGLLAPSLWQRIGQAAQAGQGAQAGGAHGGAATVAADPPRSAMRVLDGKAESRADNRADNRAEAHGDPKAEARADKEPQPLHRCFPGDTGISPPRPLDALLDRSADFYDQGQFEQSLACAEEATRVEPRSVEGHHDRAAALEELHRTDEAQDAFARALSLDPDDPETLAGAADFYVNRLPASNDHSETGLEYARRGTRKVKRGREKGLLGRLALLEGQALNDLGRSREALARLDVALVSLPTDAHVLYERAVALFELCRFADARKDLLEVIERSPDDAWAHHHLGLVEERTAEPVAAERELGRARALSPADFKAPVLPSEKEFRALVDGECERLPKALREDLAKVTLETADLPDIADLTAEEPPLSPTILGLFRGAPLGDPMADDRDPRTIVIYRKNLARAVISHDELVTQIRTTLLHELGHLRGEDDDDLRARGLE